jgi:TolA-binding protein
VEPVKQRPCPDDLLARARRGGISDLERRALDAHLAHCGLCRASVGVAGLLHRPDPERPGDIDLIDRVADRASGALSVRPRWAARSARRLAFAAALVVGTGSAALAWMAGRRAPAPPAEVTPRPPSTTVEARPVAAPADPRIEPLASSPATATPPSESPSRRPAPRLSALAGPKETTAAAMFAAANGVRRSGALADAIGRYAALRRKFPGSPEARVSAVSLGDLFLERGAPRQAFAAYDAYLAEAPGGPLTEEALFGRGRALGRLGRSGDELETWRLLLRSFPRSAYQEFARRRLEELR